MKIEKARDEDLSDLRKMYLLMLMERQEQGHNFLANEETVDWFMTTVLEPAVASEDDGVFVARDHGAVIGALFWCEAPMPIRTRYKWACSWGMYVLMGWRGQGIARAMLEHAGEWAKRRGISRVLDEALTPAARDAATKAGWKISPDVVILEV